MLLIKQYHICALIAKTVLPILMSFVLSVHLLAQPFTQQGLSIEVRTKDLLSRLTLEEKIGLLGYAAKPVNRLAIPAYNWWNEGLHGVARAGKATVFPQAIALAATFNDSLVQSVADIISTEARAKYNEAVKLHNRSQYMGLTFWSPNINVFRDPRWGRGQETYGEDPFLTATMGVAFVKGLQGNDAKYLKAAACAKHFAVHSGPEAFRHSFDAVVSEKDLRETYLYAFEKLVDAKVEAVMCAYNRLNGTPCCTNKSLLTDILRNEWHFKGHIVSDCWALDDVYKGHKVVDNPVEVAALALKSGLNLDCSELLQQNLKKAVDAGLLTVSDIDMALMPTIRTQIKLGMYDRNTKHPYNLFSANDVHTVQHVQVARKAAQQSMVLLKNNNILPLNKDRYKSIMVIGANASSIPVLVANYHGMSGDMVTFVEGITEAAGAGIGVQYESGSDYFDTLHYGGVWAAGNTDITIAVVGLTPLLEGEEHDAFLSVSGGDKNSLSIPQPHIQLLRKLKKNNKPLVVVVTAGSAVDLSEIHSLADAVILAWYPGEQGGHALADILFGKVSPSGKLPVTFYQSLTDLPAYDNYSMQGRTYRYYNGAVQYPFGYGLSYTSFEYKWQQQALKQYGLNDTIRLSIQVKNTGNMNADEVVQLYMQYPAVAGMPLKELKAFKRVYVARNKSAVVQLSVPVKELMKWDSSSNQWNLFSGSYQLNIGKHANDVQLSQQIIINQ